MNLLAYLFLFAVQNGRKNGENYSCVAPEIVL